MAVGDACEDRAEAQHDDRDLTANVPQIQREERAGQGSERE